MQEVVHEYGGTMIAAICATLVIGLLFFGLRYGDGQGVFAILGEAGEMATVEAEESFQSALAHEEEEKPVILAPNGLRKGTSYGVSEIFSKNSPKNLHVRILKIWNMEEQDVTKQLLYGEQVRFSEEGVYRLRIWAEDENGHSTTEEIFLGINP